MPYDVRIRYQEVDREDVAADRLDDRADRVDRVAGWSQAWDVLIAMGLGKVGTGDLTADDRADMGRLLAAWATAGTDA